MENVDGSKLNLIAIRLAQIISAKSVFHTLHFLYY
jgi:hypothetical protein